MILDGAAVCSCLVLASSAVGADIVTVEGLANDDALTDVQKAFNSQGGVQCGFCTPGLIVAVSHLLDLNSNPTDLEIKEAISGNICRCTGYGRIFAAVRTASESRRVSDQ